MANLSSVTVLVKSMDDRSMLESALIENIEREDLNPIEIAQAIRLMKEQFSLSQDEIADVLSKDRSSISNFLRLLSLPDDVQKLLLNGRIEFGHAKVILSVPIEMKQRELAAKIAEGGWSVRRAEDEARRMINDLKGEPAGRPNADDPWAALEQEFSRHLGTDVTLKLRKSGETFCGKMEIRIHSNEDVNRILGVVRKGAIEARAI